MKKTELPEKEYNKLLDFVITEIQSHGLKSTTMDSLAAKLQMSKRTLYEIFSNKNEMISVALNKMHQRQVKIYQNIFSNSSNTMEALIKCLLANRDMMSNMSVDFFKDLKDFSDEMKESEEIGRRHFSVIVNILNKGAEEGFIRKDVNFIVSCRMLGIQMESLKRMEELFPPDITLLEVYDSISTAFLRSLSTQKGLELMDRLLQENN